VERSFLETALEHVSSALRRRKYKNTMTDKTILPEWLQKEILNDARMGVPEISDRDLACEVLPDLDYEAQLIAIADLLRQHGEADTHTTVQIREVEDFARKSTGLRNERAVDDWVAMLHGSTYQGAAHSMAALGMLAPLIESLFYQAFQGIRTQYYGLDIIPAGHARSGMAKADDFWDCHFLFNPKVKSKKQKELVPGIMELAEAIALTPHLPGDLLPILKAVFRYRNKMFHFGFEWPSRECANFAKDMAAEGWGAWFSSATRDRVPFIFYMTDELINLSFDLVHRLLEGFGAYCRTKMPIGEIPTEI
jgi:hypothetical protein